MSDDADYADLWTYVRGTLDAAIDAEMYIAGYGHAIDGTYVNSNGIHVDPPNWSYPMADNGQQVVSGGVGVNVYNDIYMKWYHRVNELFTPYFDLPDPANFDAEARDLKKAIQQLATKARTDSSGSSDTKGSDIDYEANSTLGEAQTVAQDLTLWQGSAAEQFQNYLNLFMSVVGNQAEAADATRACLYMEKEFWTKTRTDVANLAKNSQEAFKAVGHGGDFASLVSLVSTISTVLGWFPGFSAVTGVLDKGTSVAGVFMDTFGGETQPPSNPLSGGGCEAVWGKIEHASKDLQSKARQVETDINTSLTNIYSRISTVRLRPDGTRDQQPYTLDRPDGIIDADSRKDVAKKRMYVEPSTMRTAAKYLKHDLAYELHDAAKHLVPTDDAIIWQRDPSIGMGATGPRAEYEKVREFLSTEVQQTGDEMEWAGDTLAAVAASFEKGDTAVATALTQLHKKVNTSPVVH